MCFKVHLSPANWWCRHCSPWSPAWWTSSCTPSLEPKRGSSHTAVVWRTYHKAHCSTSQRTVLTTGKKNTRHISGSCSFCQNVSKTQFQLKPLCMVHYTLRGTLGRTALNLTDIALVHILLTSGGKKKIWGVHSSKQTFKCWDVALSLLFLKDKQCRRLQKVPAYLMYVVLTRGPCSVWFLKRDPWPRWRLLCWYLTEKEHSAMWVTIWTKIKLLDFSNVC